MTMKFDWVGLSLSSTLTSPDAVNFLPSTWPPPADFPVCVDSRGNVCSRFGDPLWDITPWAGVKAKLNFGDGPPRGKAARISKENADLFRQVAGWWLWGQHAVRTAGDLVKRFEDLRWLFVCCSQERISADELMRFPKVFERYSMSIASSSASNVLRLLHDLWDAREALGFVLIDESGLANLATAMPLHEKAQTPYIPPRIWLYQVSRLRECLDDFLAHRDQIEKCFRACLDMHRSPSDGLLKAIRNQKRRPYPSIGEEGQDATFAALAESIGIAHLLSKWVGKESSSESLTVKTLANYFTLIGYVGTAYMLSFSLMRVGESWSLRSNCLTVERDPVDEDIYILQGPTTKTIEDDDARWITSPSARVAVEAMSAVARLRMEAARMNPSVPVTQEEMENPYLFVRAYEPWVSNCGDRSQPFDIRPTPDTYGLFVSHFPKLFSAAQLSMTHEDLEIALLLTPTLDPEKFAVGKPWPLAWHQLRRTGAVNMCASGVVGDSSVQYQLKHAIRAMSRYYGQGYFHLKLRLNQEARGEYIRAMYETIAREFALLGSERFVSPYGEEHKARILNLVDQKTHRSLVKDAKLGRIAYREHQLGGCTNPNPCDKGGIESVAPCGGRDKACEHLLYDKKRAPSYRSLRKVIAAQLLDAEPASPLSESLAAQLINVEEAINVCEK